ncbi:LysR family transcriptional regulator [Kineosporia succinea]|uniref:DNA-binding transcriptional LysR family regulator n=1 Tax=Kineosporia succinea TaxID=84632 RepID=A0ABT9P7I6_9ACTN|nr:LysR family transcriptional regulator [Kineosporia succinea]MDP9828670.1 DNA-binding transcriptional LysR family regulator [Kineosporia succinea]
MMDLVALRSLIAVGEHGTVAAAAQAGGYTPSAVSQQIKRLEKDLSAVLLERVGRGVVLTEQGRALVQHGHGILRQVEAATAGINGHGAEPAGPLRIVAFSTAVRGLVAPLLADLARSAPGLVPELFERDPFDAVDSVAAGQADIGLVHHWVGVPLHRPDHVAAQFIGFDTADLLVHRDHRLAREELVTPADLVDEPWASTPVGTICHGWFVYMFTGFARPPAVRMWVEEFGSQLRLVEEGVAVALLPRLGRGTLPDDVVAVPVAGPAPTRVIEMIWRDSMSASPAIRRVRERCQAVFADRGEGFDPSDEYRSTLL